LDALDAPGCPICSLLLEDGRRYLDDVMYERVTDVPTREAWRRSFGLCNLHTWQLIDVSGSSAPDLGFAIIAADLLKGFERSLSEPQARATRKLAALGGVFERIRIRLRTKPRRTTCPACHETAASESYHLRYLLECLQCEEFRRTYEASAGICVPHFALVENQSSDHEHFPILRAIQAIKARTLRGQLEEFVERQDHRSRERLTADHTSAWRRALEFLSGKPGAFGNQLDPKRPWRFRKGA
jgi:RNase P subunit RPR2